jgi:hypothetical protein
MEKLEVTMDISEASLETLAAAIMEDFQEKVQSAVDDCDLDDKIESAIESYDLDDKIQSWMDYNLDVESDIKEVIRHMDLADYIDTDSIDIENSVRNLMESFSPINACSTGKAAMDIIQSTIRYLLLKDEDFVNDISKAIKKHELIQILDEEKNRAIDAAKPYIIEDFKRELKEYSDEIARQKTLENNPSINNLTYNAWQQ